MTRNERRIKKSRTFLCRRTVWGGVIIFQRSSGWTLSGLERDPNMWYQIYESRLMVPSLSSPPILREASPKSSRSVNMWLHTHPRGPKFALP